MEEQMALACTVKTAGIVCLSCLGFFICNFTKPKPQRASKSHKEPLCAQLKPFHSLKPQRAKRRLSPGYFSLFLGGETLSCVLWHGSVCSHRWKLSLLFQPTNQPPTTNTPSLLIPRPPPPPHPNTHLKRSQICISKGSPSAKHVYSPFTFSTVKSVEYMMQNKHKISNGCTQTLWAGPQTPPGGDAECSLPLTKPSTVKAFPRAAGVCLTPSLGKQPCVKSNAPPWNSSLLWSVISEERMPCCGLSWAFPLPFCPPPPPTKCCCCVDLGRSQITVLQQPLIHKHEGFRCPVENIVLVQEVKINWERDK